MRCVVCNGQRGEDGGGKCPGCGGTGVFAVIGCPWKQESADVTAALEMERMAREGKGLPVGGGWTDQTRLALDALAFIEEERAAWKVEV